LEIGNVNAVHEWLDIWHTTATNSMHVTLHAIKMMGGSTPKRGQMPFLFSKSEDELWGPPSLLFDGFWGVSYQKYSSMAMELTTHLHFIFTLRIDAAIPLLPKWLHGAQWGNFTFSVISET
jgi:hypothetical protein